MVLFIYLAFFEPCKVLFRPSHSSAGSPGCLSLLSASSDDHADCDIKANFEEVSASLFASLPTYYTNNHTDDVQAPTLLQLHPPTREANIKCNIKLQYILQINTTHIKHLNFTKSGRF